MVKANERQANKQKRYKQLINQGVVFPLPFVLVSSLSFFSSRCLTLKSFFIPSEEKGTNSLIVVYLALATVFFTVFFFYLLTAGNSPTVGRFFFSFFHKRGFAQKKKSFCPRTNIHHRKSLSE
jgi:hypothetical protein